MTVNKLRQGVAVVGAGMSQFGTFKEKATRDLFVEAFQEVRNSVDKGLNPRDIQALYIGNFSSELLEGQGHTAPIMADWAGLAPIPATRVEDACASSGSPCARALWQSLPASTMWCWSAAARR
jgi:acetyl-CoA C-acetyltransferase